MVDGPRSKGDDAQGAEYWRREADRLQLVVNELRERVEELTAPLNMVFRGVDNGVMYERSIIRIPAEHWEPEVERFPHLASWDWASSGGLCFLVSPVDVARIASREPVARVD